MKKNLRIDDAVFRDLDRLRRQARPQRKALASGLVAQAMVSPSAASRDVPTTLDLRDTSASLESRGTDAVRAAVSVF